MSQGIDKVTFVRSYTRIQQFKDIHAAALPMVMRAELEGLVREQLLAACAPQSDHAVATTLDGMSWVAAICQKYDLPLEPTLITVPREIVRNTLENSKPTVYDPNAVRLGVGAGYFTGLGQGLELASLRK